MKIYCRLPRHCKIAEVIIDKNTPTSAKIIQSKILLNLLCAYPHRSFERRRVDRRMVVIRQGNEGDEIVATFGIASISPGDWFPCFSRDIKTALEMRKGEIDFFFDAYDVARDHRPDLIRKYVASIGDMQ